MNNTQEWFMERVSMDPNNGCWLWLGAFYPLGYGMVTVHGTRKPTQAHRMSYLLFNGSIPEGLHLDHLCRVRGCVNPQHLEAVTKKENTLRGFGITAMHARKTHCAKGHEFTNENTKIIYRNGARAGRACIACAPIYARDAYIRKMKGKGELVCGLNK